MRGNGADKTYAKYRVDVDGNAFLGHQVIVGGTADNKAPARRYFDKAAFDVDHLNSWAAWTGTLLMITGAAFTSLSSVLLVVGVNPQVLPIPLLCVCALPTLLCSLAFTTWSEWDMQEAGDDYNTKLRSMIDEATSTPASAGPATTTSAEGGSDESADYEHGDPRQGTDQGEQQPEPEMAPFDY